MVKKNLSKHKTNKSICALKDSITNSLGNSLNKSYKKMSSGISKISKIGDKANSFKKGYLKKVDKLNKEAQGGFISDIKKQWKTRYGYKISGRPDLMFLLDMVIGGVFIFLVYHLVIKVKGGIQQFFTNRDLFNNLGKVPLNQLDPETFRKEKMKLEASRSHEIYYKIKPFGEFSEDDKMQMQFAQVSMQVMIFVVIYFVVPL